MESVSLSTIERLAANAANNDDFQFSRWNSHTSPASINIAGLVIGALCSEHRPSERFGPTSAISQGVELRERLVLNLLRCAVHDFHRSSSTHLFFSFYSASCAVRAFHAFKDKAFTTYLIESGKLAVESEVDQISEWNAFLEGEARNSGVPVAPAAGEVPCSGIINFRLDPSNATLVELLLSEMSISFNRLAVMAFGESTKSLDLVIRRTGVSALGNEVRKLGQCVDPLTWKQKTVRVPKSSHAVLIGIAHELAVSVSALATYLFNRRITSPAKFALDASLLKHF
jgi:hypothetical protein